MLLIYTSVLSVILVLVVCAVNHNRASWYRADGRPDSAGIATRLQASGETMNARHGSITAPEVARTCDVKVVTLGASHSSAGLSNVLLKLFPQAVAVRAVDGRRMSPEDAVRNGTLSLAGYKSIVRGRSQHSQLPTMGALGLYLSWRSALQGHGPLLLIEEDCEVSDGLYDALRQFQTLQLDVAMMGAQALGGRHRSTWVIAPDAAYGTHCVAFTARGRERVRAHVNAHAASLQVDALLCELSAAQGILLGVCVDKTVAWQSHSRTSIQLAERHARVPVDLIDYRLAKQPSTPLIKNGTAVALSILIFTTIVTVMALLYLIIERRENRPPQ